MKRPLRPEDIRVWTLVARTVTAAAGAVLPVIDETSAPPVKARRGAASVHPGPATPTPAPARVRALRPKSQRAHLDPIEPGRKRRIVRERDPIDATIDLHGLGQFAAEDRLKAFVVTAQALGHRAILVITGKGVLGDGVIRRRARDWLADAALREVVAGVSSAHARHGGDGALYVAIKRRPER